MGGSEDDNDKQFEPTQKKLDDARKKGEVPKSADLNTAASYGGFLITAAFFGAYTLSGLASELSDILARAPDLADDIFTGGAQANVGDMLGSVAGWTALWFAGPAFAVVLSVIMQKSFVVAPSKIEPKLSRISILANANNRFGRNGLFEFAKSFAKLLIYATVLGWFLAGRLPTLIVAVQLAPNQITALMLEMARSFLVAVLFVAAGVGSVDIFWQYAEHTRKNRMSRQEMMDEAKQSEGDPHLKQQRRQRGQEIAMNRMLADVPTADVVIVNPSHFAVALKWSRAPGSAPICVAKGVDSIAARIRETAMSSGVPIHRDPPTARAIFAVVEIGREIDPEHYRAVAAAIRFADAMKQKSKSGGRER
jgi:flagellar biosynthetic protein FlhB